MVEKKGAGQVLSFYLPVRCSQLRGSFHSLKASTGVLMLIGAVGISVGSSALARLRRKRRD
jgi:hypothetical protein